MKSAKSVSLFVAALAWISLLGCAIIIGGQTIAPTNLPPSALPTQVVVLPSAQPTQALRLPSPQPTQPSLPPTPDTRTEVRIGIVYPISGRLENWGKEALPIIQMAEADINNTPEAVAAGKRFRFVVVSSETTAEGALAAVKDLVEKQGIQVIVGIPTSTELEGAIPHLTQYQVAAINSASTAPLPALSKPDTVFRIAPPELYVARTHAQFALNQGYRKAAVIYRTDDWGPRYADEFVAQFKAKGYPTALVPIPPTHPQVQDYAPQVTQLSAQVAKLGADEQTIVFMAVWEGEDLNILHHATQDATLSRVRWSSAVLYPSLRSGNFVDQVVLPDARDFALAHNVWGAESYLPMNEPLRRMRAAVQAQLGREPRLEHIYLYDAMQIAARAVLLAGTAKGNAVAAMIPSATQKYAPVTGIIRFDANGDRASGDLAFYGLFKEGSTWVYRYYAFYDSQTNQFRILSQPEKREAIFCPEC